MPDLVTTMKTSMCGVMGLGRCFPGALGWGCGESYYGDWYTDPHSKCEPCDNHGNWIGPRGQYDGHPLPEGTVTDETVVPSEPSVMPPDAAPPEPMPSAANPGRSTYQQLPPRRRFSPASGYGFPR